MSGQAYQDPKDALNEFVSNAADEYLEAGTAGRVRVVLRRRGRAPVLAVDDDGRGSARTGCVRWPATCLSRSRPATVGRLVRRPSGCSPISSSARCDVVSRAADSNETWVLRLTRGEANAQLEQETPPYPRCAGHDGVHLRSGAGRVAGAHSAQGCRLPAPATQRNARSGGIHDRGRRGPADRARHRGAARRDQAAHPGPFDVVGAHRVRGVRRPGRWPPAPSRCGRAGGDDDHR